MSDDLDERLRAFTRIDFDRQVKMTARIRYKHKDWRVAIRHAGDEKAHVYIGIGDTYESALRAALEQAEDA